MKSRRRNLHWGDLNMAELNRIKSWLYRQRTKVRQESERAERRQSKEEAETQRKAEQSALFQF